MSVKFDDVNTEDLVTWDNNGVKRLLYEIVNKDEHLKIITIQSADDFNQRNYNNHYVKNNES